MSLMIFILKNITNAFSIDYLALKMYLIMPPPTSRIKGATLTLALGLTTLAAQGLGCNLT